MKRTIIIVCIIALIAAMMVTPAAAATTRYVCPTCDYTNIQTAIDASSEGDTVFVYNGTYVLTSYPNPTYSYRLLLENPNLTLKGESANDVTLDGYGGAWIIGIGVTGTGGEAPGCVIDGFRIINSSLGVGVYDNSPNCIVRNNVFDGLLDKAFLAQGSNTTFESNVVVNVTGTYTAVEVTAGEGVESVKIVNNTIINNKCTSGTSSRALTLKYANNCTIINNTITGNNGDGIRIWKTTTANNVITKNNISANTRCGIYLYDAGIGNKLYLNDFIDNPTSVIYSGVAPATIYWNSTEPIEYVYDGTTHTNYLGNYWSDYTNGDTDGDGIGDTDYDTLPTDPNPVYNDTRPLMAGFENYLGAPAAEPPHLVTYTILNRTITPPQTTEIDVEFSETVSYKIAIEKDTATIYDWTGTAKNPAAKVWNGTYEVNSSVVPEGDYTVNVTGTNTTTGLSVVNNTEVITVMTMTEQPDLIVTAINAYHNNTGCSAWFNLSNEVDVTVKNDGTATAGASNVSLRIEGDYGDTAMYYFGKLPVSSLAAGASETVRFTDWVPIGDDCLQEPCNYMDSYKDYNFTAVADCDDGVAESDETNNATTMQDRTCYNGYMADEPLENVAHGVLHGGVLFTTGDGSYGGLYSVGDSRDTNYNITIPEAASVEFAHLKVFYTWHYEKTSCPQMEVSITNATGTYTLPLEKAYNDIKCTCPGAAWVFPWGNYVYDLTDYITGSGTYTVTVKRTGGPSFCIAAPGVDLVYEDANAPLIEYWINEGADVLIGGRRSDGGYLAWWECMNNATFPASSQTEEVVNATLGVVSPWGDGVPDDILFLNGVELGRGVYNGYSSPYSITIDSLTMEIGAGNAQVGINATDVTALYLNDSENVVTQADDGDNIMACNAFLVVEYEEEAVVPWKGYLVPQNSTGSYGGDTAVEFWVTYNDTGLTYGAIGWQVDVHFDPNCVNVTAADFSTSPFNINAFTPYASGVVRVGGNNYGLGAISSGTYKMATLTFHGESSTPCTCDVWFDTNVVSDTDMKPIANTYTDGMYTCAGVAEPDLLVTGITPNCGYLFANESNEISATIKNNGTADAGAFNVSFVLDGSTAKVSVGALGAGNDTEVSITDPTLRYAGATVSITVTADCDGAIAESNETNNASALTASVMNSGYKGKRYTGGEDIKTVQTDRLNGNLLYSVGDSKYLSGSATAWYTYTANWTASNLPVPGDASIEKARLYVMYTWDKVQGMPDNVSMKFNNNPKTRDAFYTDRKGFGSSNYPYGMLVYNVTGDFNRSGNTAVLENLNPVAGNPSMRGMLLVVVYAEESEPERTIVVNEEFDLLYGGTAQCTTPEEATAYAPFGAINLTGVEKATLITVAPGAGPDEGELIFNGQMWYDVWNYAGSSQIGINETDVTSYVNATGNEAGFQGSADYMEASNAFLMVTYTVPEAAPTADSFGVGDASGRSGTYVQVPVNITNVRNGPVQGIRCRVDYNESVLNLTSISNGDLTSAWTALQLGVDRHTITIATAYTGAAIPDGSSGSVVLLNFSVIGSPGDTSPMSMTLIELSNPDGIVGTAPAKNGTFVVPRFGSIAGRITYACNGTGIAGVVVNLTDESIVNSTITNETGYYNFMDVIPDSYVVNASKPRFWDNSTEVTVIAGEIITADMMLWLKGDLNNDGNVADAGDVVLMLRASVGDIPGDMRYDLNGNGEIGDAGDVVVILRVSVGDIELL